MRNPFKDKEFMSKFWKVSLPVMFHAFVMFIVTFVDNLMVGSLSDAAVSGVYAANQATFIFIVCSFGVISGAGIMIQQFYGAKDNEHQMQSFRMKLFFTTIFLLVTIPLYYFFVNKLISFYCSKDANYAEILEQGMQYIDIAIISYIPFAYGTVYSTSLRETGKTKYAMYGGIAALAVNITFNSIFIYGLKMGVKGAALATVLARVVELTVLVVISHVKKLDFCKGAYRNVFHVEGFLVKKICRKSVLLFLNELFWVSGMIAISLAYSQRDGVLSALAIVSTMGDVFSIIFNGLSVGIGVLVGSSLGAGEFDKAKDYVRKFYALGLIISGMATVLFCCLSPLIPLMYTEVGADQKTLATYLIIVYSCFIPFFSTSANSYTILKTGGKTVLTFCLDSVLIWTVFIPAAWLLATLTSLPMIVIYIVVQSADVVKSIIGILLVKRGTWVQNLTTKETKIEEPQIENA